jgi:hypothetical protein
MATFNKTLSGTDYIITSGDVLSSTYGLGYFGDGTDGDATITGSFTAGRELYYNNLSITGTGSFKPNGYKIYVKETLTIEASASINDDGNVPVGTTGALLINTRNYLGGAAGGGANSIINAAAAGNNGGGSGGNSSLNVFNLAPTGGVGGTAGVRAGGNGGGAAQPSPNQKWNGRWYDGRFSGGSFNGGSGGGSGGCATADPALASGAGGGGAGIVWVSAKNVVNNGRISANGGNGGNASGSAGAAAGGGGGAGGLVCLITKSTSYGVVTANGGSGGSGVVGGGSGNAGSSGSVAIIIVS